MDPVESLEEPNKIPILVLTSYSILVKYASMKHEDLFEKPQYFNLFRSLLRFTVSNAFE